MDRAGRVLRCGRLLGVLVDVGDEPPVPLGSDVDLEVGGLKLHPDLWRSFLFDLVGKTGMGCERFEPNLVGTVGKYHQPPAEVIVVFCHGRDRVVLVGLVVEVDGPMFPIPGALVVEPSPPFVSLEVDVKGPLGVAEPVVVMMPNAPESDATVLNGRLVTSASAMFTAK